MKDYSKGYKTYYLGVPDNIISSQKIRLYLNRDEPVSLDNLLSLHEQNFKNNKSGFNSDIQRKSTGDQEEALYHILCVDEENPEKSLSISFDTIIYYSHTSNLPIGFTRFNHEQSTEIDGENSRISELNIKTKFIVNDNLEDKTYDFQVKVINSLKYLYDNSLGGTTENSEYSLKFLGSENNEYVSLREVENSINQDSVNKNYVRYSNFLGQLLSDDSMVTMTDCSFFSNGDKKSGILDAYSFYINSGLEITEYNASFNKFYIGTYKNDIALYGWGIEVSNNISYWVYKAVSLTKKNRFNQPVTLIPVGKCEVLDGFELEYISSHYASLVNKNTGTQAFLDILNNSLINLGESCYAFIDPWDFSEKIYHFPREVSSLRDYFIENTQLFKEYCALPKNSVTRSESLFFKRKIGDWFIFEGYQSDGYKPQIYLSKNGKFYFSSDEEVFPVSNRCILSQTHIDRSFLERTVDGGERLRVKRVTRFTFYFIEEGITVESDKYLDDKRSSIKKNDYNDYKISFYSDPTIYDPDVDSDSNTIQRKLVLDGFRKKVMYSPSYALPEDGFLTSFRGILFYQEPSKLEIEQDLSLKNKIKIYCL